MAWHGLRVCFVLCCGSRAGEGGEACSCVIDDADADVMGLGGGWMIAVRPVCFVLFRFMHDIPVLLCVRWRGGVGMAWGFWGGMW